MKKPLSVSAPGRICLFGEHQDYLGLPVIAAAINLRIGVHAVPRSDNLFVLDMPDTDERIQIDPAVEQQYAHRRDYLRSAVNILRRSGVTWRTGYNITMRGAIPINAGVSSSSAMVVMWLRYLLEIGEQRLDYSDEDLARWGHQAEVTEFNEPGGMMDHYCAALGGILHIDTRPPFSASRWNVALNGIVLGHSLQPKATIETLSRNRRDVTLGIELMKQRLPHFDLASTDLEEAEEHLGKLPRDPARRLRANLKNRDITRKGQSSICSADFKELGRLLYEHHTHLRDGLDLSTDKIEKMMNAALNAGALGGKINGSGGGGCMFAYAPDRENEVAEAIKSEGGVPYIVRVDEGARFESI